MPSTLKQAFTDHPASVGETYFEHLIHASGFGVRMVLGGFACVLHGLLPFLFVKTGSKQIETPAWANDRESQQAASAHRFRDLIASAEPEKKHSHFAGKPLRWRNEAFCILLPRRRAQRDVSRAWV